jgi:hypothetical protein
MLQRKLQSSNNLEMNLTTTIDEDNQLHCGTSNGLTAQATSATIKQSELSLSQLSGEYTFFSIEFKQKTENLC